MARKRISFSFSVLQIALLGIGGLSALIVSFVLGMLAGREIQGNSIFDGEVKSQVVKMRIEPLPEAQSTLTPSGDEKQVVMKNVTSKPLITFYDILSKTRRTELPGSNHSTRGNGDFHGKRADEKEHRTAKTASETKRETDSAPRKLYTVQVGAMKDKALADAMVSKLKRAGYSAYIASSESTGKGAWYKVRLGTFPDKEGARGQVVRIKKNEGLQATVVEK